VLVRTDWCDTFALLARLVAEPQGPAVLSGRLLAILQQRRVVGGPHLFEALLPSDDLREAIAAGADRAHLVELARRGGFLTLAEQAAARVADGSLTEAEAARALT
jgi:type II secretory ATPase GspE/PulE/Tfp pilus assembly ATPase PilB-like protein